MSDVLEGTGAKGLTGRGWPVRAAISLTVVGVLAGAWQVASVFYTSESSAGTPLVPGWQWLATHSFPSLSSYAGGGFGSITEGSYSGALRALGEHSLDTGLRVLAGLVGGVLTGVGFGIAVAWSRWARRLLMLPAHILRTVPLLAMIPLFQLWFGLSFTGFFLFVAYGIGVVMFAGTISAIANVPPIYVDNARVLGASDLRVYFSVVLPSIFPELRSSFLLSLGVAWGAVVGAEFVGAQTGLGYIVVSAEEFALLDRIAVVSIVFIIYAMITLVFFDRLSRSLVAWMPKEMH